MLNLIRSRPLACMLAAILLAVSAAGAAMAQQAPPSREVSVELRMPLGESRVELALTHAGTRHLPTLRFLTPQAAADRPGRWLRSSSIEISGIDGDLRVAIRISPATQSGQQTTPERYEAAVVYDDEILLPAIRFAAGSGRSGFQGRWITFSSVTLPADEDEETGTDSGGAGPGEEGGQEPGPVTVVNEGDGEGGEPASPGGDDAGNEGASDEGTGDDADAAPLAFTSAPGNQTFSEGTQIDAIVLPAAEGGSGALRYDLIHRIRGLAFNRDTRTLSGTPATAGRHLVFYTVTDAVGTAANSTFFITVEASAPTPPTRRGPDTRPTFGAQLIAPQAWVVGTAISPMTLPKAAGGNDPLRYDLDPAIAGISFDRASRTVSGTPEASGGFSMRYSATDVDGDGVSIRFPIQIAVETDSEPQFPRITLDFDFTAGEAQRIALPLATGGNGGLLYSLAPGIPGMTFDVGTRTLSGAPTDAGSYNMVYAATDADGDSDSLAFLIAVSPSTGPQFADSASGLDRTYTAGVAASDTYPAAVGGIAPVTYTLAPDIPGMTFNADSRTHRGTPSEAGTYRMTYTATDALQLSRVLAFTITVRGADPPDLQPSFGDERLGDFYGLIAGEPFAVAIPVATGGNPPLTYSLSGAPGLSVPSSGGRITGTPARAGEFTVTYTVTDADGDMASIDGDWVISAPPEGTTRTNVDDADASPAFIASPPNINAMAEVAMSVVLPAARGGDPPLEYALSTVPGLAFDSATRTLSGTPAAAGSRELVYIVYDADRDIDTRRFALNVAPASADRAPSFGASAYTCSGAAGRPLICTLPAATGGDGQLSYSTTALSLLPLRARFSPASRVFSAAPTAADTHRLAYAAVDEDGDTARMTVTIIITAAPSADGPAFASNMHAVSTTAGPGQSLSETLPAAEGGDEPLTYSLETPPQGLSFVAASRALSGRAADGTAGSHRLAYTVTDADGDSDTMTIELTIAAGAEEDRMPSFAPITSHLCSGTAGTAFSCTLPESRGGDGTLAYSLPTPPQGLVFTAATRTLSGAPAAAGRHVLKYTATDADGDTDTISVTISVVAAPPDRKPTFTVTGHTCEGTVGEALSCTLPAASDGDGTLTYSFETPPEGLAFDTSTRVLSGTPDAEFRNFLDYFAFDADGDDAELSVWLEIESPQAPASAAVTFGGDSYSGFEGRVGEALLATLPIASGGSGALTYSLSRTFPGLAFNSSTAVLRGTPSEAFSGWVTLSAADATGGRGQIRFLVQIRRAALSGTPPPAADGSPSFPARTFTATTTEGPGLHWLVETLPAATGGDGTLTYTLATPPQGLTFYASRRIISGRAAPGTAGSYSLDYTASDEDGDTATMTVELTIAAGGSEDRSPSFAHTRSRHLCSGVARVAFSCTLPAATGGDGTLTYTLATPPQGLRFNAASRLLIGTPSAAASGRHFLEYTAEDADGDEATFSVTVDIAAPVDRTPSFSASTHTCSGTAGSAFSCTLPAASGGDGTLSYSLARQVEGLSFNGSSRVLSGTPSASGNHRIAYSATDADGDSIQIDIIVRIAADSDTTDATPTFGRAAYVVEGTNGTALSVTLPAATGGDGGITYSLSAPIPGLGLNRARRILSGTPTRTGSSIVTYIATDEDGDRATMTLNVRIAAGAATDTTPAFASEDGGAINGVVGQALSVSLATASGGNGALTYSTNWLPDGVTVNSSTALMSGTPSAAFRGRVQLTATDADGDRDTIWYTVTITAAATTPAPTDTNTDADTAPEFASDDGGSINGVVGQVLSVSLATASGGNGALTYSANRLPDGVVVNSSTALMSGTPSATFQGSVQLTATDTDGDRDTISYTVTITAASDSDDRTPSFSVSSHTCSVTTGTTFSCTLPAASGGDGTLRYELVAAGVFNLRRLTFVKSTRTLSAVPTTAGTVNLAYSAIDEDGDRARLTITVSITAATDTQPAFSSSDVGTTYEATVGTAFSETLPAASGGNGSLQYALGSTVPGLALNGQTRVLSGTPDTAGTYRVQYSATDDDGDQASIELVVRVRQPAPPAPEPNREPAFSGGYIRVEGTVGEKLSTTFKEATGGDGTLSYSLSGTVPGLTFDSSTRVYSGTPSEARNHLLTYTVTDADGDQDSVSVNVIIAAAGPPDLTPTFGSTTSYSCEGTVGSAFSCTLPEATGGDGTLTYSLGTVVEGISFAASSRAVSGTLPSEARSYTATYTATDADGDTATLLFILNVEAE